MPKVSRKPTKIHKPLPSDSYHALFNPRQLARNFNTWTKRVPEPLVRYLARTGLTSLIMSADNALHVLAGALGLCSHCRGYCGCEECCFTTAAEGFGKLTQPVNKKVLTELWCERVLGHAYYVAESFYRSNPRDYPKIEMKALNVAENKSRGYNSHGH